MAVGRFPPQTNSFFQYQRCLTSVASKFQSERGTVAASELSFQRFKLYHDPSPLLRPSAMKPAPWTINIIAMPLAVSKQLPILPFPSYIFSRHSPSSKDSTCASSTPGMNLLVQRLTHIAELDAAKCHPSDYWSHN
jgi:hypothetical protein